jgi:hypothetical protein
MEDFDAKVWMTSAGLSEKGQKKLFDAEISDEVTVRYIDEETLVSLKLAPGDNIRFRRAQDLLVKEHDVLPDLGENTSLKAAKEAKEAIEAKDAKEAADSLDSGEAKYTIDQFAKFLAGEADLKGKKTSSSEKILGGVELHIPSSTKSLQSSAVLPTATEEAVKLGKSLMTDILCLDDCATNAKGERPLLPVNFVSTPKGIIIDQDQVVTIDKDGSMKLKPNKYKPTPDKITVGQWVSANARIMSKLMPKFTPKTSLITWTIFEK